MSNIRTGDTVVITNGKDRGETGTVLRVLPKTDQLLVEGLNIRTKHVRARRQGEKGQRVQVPGPLHISNVKIVCDRCGRGVRVRFHVDDDGRKTRVCASCGQTL